MSLRHAGGVVPCCMHTRLHTSCQKAMQHIRLHAAACRGRGLPQNAFYVTCHHSSLSSRCCRPPYHALPTTFWPALDSCQPRPGATRRPPPCKGPEGAPCSGIRFTGAGCKLLEHGSSAGRRVAGAATCPAWKNDGGRGTQQRNNE